MDDKLDDLLRALPELPADHPLDQLEPLVWRRIERSGSATALNGFGMRLQLGVAVATLCLGLAFGWTQAGNVPTQRQQAPLLLTQTELALVTGLGAVR